jgi:hypothetical protein
MARLLKTTTLTGLDLSDWETILQLTSNNPTPIVVTIRAHLGSADGPLDTDADTYDFRFRYGTDNETGLLLPDASISKAVDLTGFNVQFGETVLSNAETLYVLARGQSTDIEVDTVTKAFDVTPYPMSELGLGDIYVNHNYGGSNALAFIEDGYPVLDGIIRCYTASDYAAANTGSNYVVAETTTDILGQWRQAFMLEAGDYILVYYKSGRPARTTSVQELTVF